MKFSLKRFLVKLILKDVKGTFLHCDYCGSPFTKYYNVNANQQDKSVKVEYEIECLKCGAKGIVIETWYKPDKEVK